MTWFRVVLACIGLTLATTPALAHKLRVFAVAEGRVISGYGFFVGGGRANGVLVTLTLSEANAPPQIVSAGSDGAFRFEVSASGIYVVHIDAGDGHVAETRVTVTLEANAPAPAPAIMSSPLPAASAAAASPTLPAAAVCLSEASLRPLLAEAIARELRPLHERLMEAESRMRFTDIAGGLGMIMGLAGAALWLRARRPLGGAP
jgi:nickel transport protein